MKKRKGFSIAEIVYVLLVSLAIMLTAIISANPVLNFAKYSAAKSETSSLTLAITQYYVQVGSFPSNLAALKTKHGDYGPWVSSDALIDPWDNNYNYSFDTARNTFAVWSNGSDGVSSSSINGISGDDIGFTGN